MKGAYITYHAFYWKIARNKFIKSIRAAGGDILMETNAKGHYLLKISNPCHQMKTHPKWQSSNNKFWNLPAQSIQTLNTNTTNK